MSTEMDLKCKMAAYYLSYLVNLDKRDKDDIPILFHEDGAFYPITWMNKSELSKFKMSCIFYGLDFRIPEGSILAFLSLPFQNVIFDFFQKIRWCGIKLNATLDFTEPSTIYTEMSRSDYLKRASRFDMPSTVRIDVRDKRIYFTFE